MTITPEEIARLRALWDLHLEEGEAELDGSSDQGTAECLSSVPLLLDEIERLRADLAAVDAAIADRGVPERDCRLPLATRVDSIIGELKEWRHDAATEAIGNEALRAGLREAMALLRDVDEFANPVGSWQRCAALLAKHKEDA